MNFGSAIRFPMSQGISRYKFHIRKPKESITSNETTADIKRTKEKDSIKWKSSGR